MTDQPEPETEPELETGPAAEPQPEAGSEPPEPQRERRISLTLAVALVVLIAGLLAAVPLGLYKAGSERVVVATGSRSAFHTAGDLTMKKVARSAVPDGAIRSLKAAQGHYLLTTVSAGQVLTKADVGPRSVARAVVMPLPVRYDSLDGIDPGVLVNLMLAPTGSDGRAVVLPKAEVVEQKKTAAGDQIVFLAIPANCQQAVAQAAGRGRLILARPSG